MDYKTILYTINLSLSMFVLSGINFDKIMKRNKVIEARLLILVLGFAISYLITNFMVDFIS